jgi:polo-like kinase 1
MKGALLGKGGFAQVFVSTSLPSKEKYALKIVAKSTLTKPRARQKLQTEINIHQALIHENVVRFLHCFEDPSYTYMILELCSNNSMSEMMNHRKRISEPESRYYLSQLVISLQYLHRHLVIHRDLKLGNLFIDKHMRLKVGDFGLAAKLENPNEKRMTVCGTPNYIAPELLNGKKGHSFEVDIWSTGIILYTFLVGKPPFQSKDVKSTYKRILSNIYSYPDGLTVSLDAKDLIACMLQARPECRPTLQQVLTHPFFTSPGVFTPASLPVTSLKETPMLLPPPGTHNSSSAATTMMKIQANASLKSADAMLKMPPTISNNENNPNMVNQPNQVFHQTHEEPTFSVRRNLELATNQENTYSAMDKLHDDKSAATRSISARMRTILAPRSTNIAAPSSTVPSGVEKFSVHATISNQEKANNLKETARPVLESKHAVSSVSNVATKSSNLTKYSTTASYRPQQPRFDIYMDSAEDENVLPPPAPLSSRSSNTNNFIQPSKAALEVGEIGANRSHTETLSVRPSTSSNSSAVIGSRLDNRSTRDTLQKLSRGFEDLKLSEQHASPEIAKSMAGQKRIDISTKDATVFTPTDRQSRSKRAKEAWSNQAIGSVVDDEKADVEHMAMSSTPPDNATKPENQLGTLEAMHDMLDQSINVMERRKVSNQFTTMDAIAMEPSVKTWVVRYVDYSSKYGLGYLFNNGSAGVYFNDSTKIVLSGDGRVFQYVERIKRESSFGSESSSQKYMIDNYPSELHKKVTLLKHFRNYLLDQVQKSTEKTIGMEDNIADTAAFRSAYNKEVVASTATLGETMSLDDDTELPYVKKWVRTKHALLFRLNNRTVQVVFYDKSEILISSEARVITYVNKVGERSEHALDDMLTSRVDIAKRLKYTKDIMHRLISSQGQPTK